jgi:hypothetical protein
MVASWLYSVLVALLCCVGLISRWRHSIHFIPRMFFMSSWLGLNWEIHQWLHLDVAFLADFLSTGYFLINLFLLLQSNNNFIRFPMVTHHEQLPTMVLMVKPTQFLDAQQIF